MMNADRPTPSDRSPAPGGSPGLLERPVFRQPWLTWEGVVFVLLLLAAVVTRFYDLETRVMSHDESLHTYYSWLLFRGQGYQHDPMMHGPFQFHIVALSYFLLGDSDFSARVPAVLFSIASVAFLWFYRQYLGRAGALAAAALMVVSPYMLYYGRYVRNESFVAFFGLVTLWSILGYLNKGSPRYLYWLTAAFALHFSTKETSFIYMAQALIFVALLVLNRLLRDEWRIPRYRVFFVISLAVAAALIILAGSLALAGGQAGDLSAENVARPAVPGQEITPQVTAETPPSLTILPAGMGLAALLLGGFFLLRGYTLEMLRRERAFDLLILLSTLVLPQLSAFPVRLMGWPLPETPGAVYNMTSENLSHFVTFLIPLILIAIAVGLWWSPGLWVRNAALFYSLFTYLYTSQFSNGRGFISGMVASLSYWLAQQSVQRGSQPWYYYLLVQVPIYEYLPLVASLLAIFLVWRRAQANQRGQDDHLDAGADPAAPLPAPPDGNQALALPLLFFWSLTSMLAYTIAGEKMPWLTVHITLPLILLGGWAIGRLIDETDWQAWRLNPGWSGLLLWLVFGLSLLASLGNLLGGQPPFQGKEIEQLQATAGFLTSLLIAAGSGWGLIQLRGGLRWPEFFRPALMLALGGLGLLTARTAFQATYINFDEGREFLVYAHGARGVKDVLEQVTDLSLRLTDGPALQIAYDDDTSWPMTWYLREFPQARYYGNTPGKDLRDLPMIIAGDNNYARIEPVVGQAFYKFETIRMVWPNQDYFTLDWTRIWQAISSPQMRAALFDIWLNRDFTRYGQALNRDLSAQSWSPSDRMRMYVRKDIAAQIWEFAAAPVTEEVIADPYEGGEVSKPAQAAVGQQGSLPGQLNRPRDLAFAPDGSLYVADTDNHRIQHLSQSGQVLHVWGSFADILAGAAPGGSFNQPWGIAVGPDGSVYVADTWNHRIQKFTAGGEFVQMWGVFGQAEDPSAFWGPRDVMVDPAGRVFVTDTGNKRVVVFDSQGQYLAQFGSFGLDSGQFDEPVGLAMDAAGRVYVTDTWNQRVQVFAEGAAGDFSPVASWEIAGWYGQSLDNKPFIAVSGLGQVIISDPEGYRVIEFTTEGKFVRYWGAFSAGLDGFGLPAGLAFDSQDRLWVADAGNHRILTFDMP